MRAAPKEQFCGAKSAEHGFLYRGQVYEVEDLGDLFEPAPDEEPGPYDTAPPEDATTQDTPPKRKKKE